MKAVNNGLEKSSVLYPRAKKIFSEGYILDTPLRTPPLHDGSMLFPSLHSLPSQTKIKTLRSIIASVLLSKVESQPQDPPMSISLGTLKWR